ncbi:CoA pyrophosphatase [Pseudoduganella sp. SL102]|uniref:CoA pyrophosphatase n=1 Tax=Pseudoduganella albidiflava TaxID=321983 RepID=A0A411X2E1_9BURK|nr:MULTISPECIES: CoA pyrophosphatase [Pseudoduganella]QBI03160.1 CoA pyrophosphatase [Pseudoduganella albidiflava]WBS04317.1 CoA pyrophosphatase [Pseudoduganella sp. SL102]GGY64766.1 coenzyme A pyrophosphatase [Pseudoduganella albidiflava]
MAKPFFDPALLPIDAIAGEPPLPPERLAPGWLRERFARTVDWFPETADESRGTRANPTPASVLVPLVLRPAGITVLLTRRTAHLNDHAGQVAFPGGRAEHDDADAVDTALRETEEEIGLHRRHIEILGTLPLYHTGTGYAVTPVVALVAPPFELKADPFEVAEIFEVPLRFLMDGAHHELRSALPPAAGAGQDRQAKRTFYTMPYEGHFIWGATAGMLRNLFHFLRA